MTNRKTTGEIFSLQLCPGYRLPMKVVEIAEAVDNTGLKSDRHANVGSSRQILLVGKETLDTLNLSPGQIKENITTTGIPLMELSPGCQLKFGDGVILEIVKPCSPCSRMEEIRPGLMKQLAGRRGMLARVVAGGLLRRGDAITIADNIP